MPCRLCWFQRIAMYPLAVILLVAAIRRDRGVRWYAGPLAAIGAVVSTYHYLVEWHPVLEGGACGVGPSCSGIWFRELGFVTLAFMALCGFVAILVLVVPARRPGDTVRSRTPLVIGIVLAVVAVARHRRRRADAAATTTTTGDDGRSSRSAAAARRRQDYARQRRRGRARVRTVR